MVRTPLQRIRFGVFSTAIVVTTSIAGYHFIGGYGLLESLWMVVITISTVGFSESPDSPPAVQLLTICVILLGVTSSVYTFGGFIQLLLEGEVERALGKRKMTRELKKMSGHVIICGFGRLGEDLAVQLTHRGIPFVVIDILPEKVKAATEKNVLAIQGDATSEEVLEQVQLLAPLRVGDRPAQRCRKRVHYPDRTEYPTRYSDHRKIRAGKKLPKTPSSRCRQDCDAPSRRCPADGADDLPPDNRRSGRIIRGGLPPGNGVG